jgi:hypothetical protein
MPGELLRGVARTAVVAGTATAVGNRVSQRQAQRWAEQGRPGYTRAPVAVQPAQAAAPPPAQPAAGDTIEQLKQLGELRDNGVLTDEEFAAQKAKILGA